MKTLTRKQLESRKAKAVRFTRDVLDDPDRADEIEDEPLESYAERRHIKIKNPKGGKLMEVRTRRELLERIQQLEKEKENLQKLKNPKGAQKTLKNAPIVQEEIDELGETLDQVADLADEALDPELTREELVAKVKEIADAVSVEGEDEEGE
jgi:vacuolar-type H+-ATPase subunit I/STV1